MPECTECGGSYRLKDGCDPRESGRCDPCEIDTLEAECASLRSCLREMRTQWAKDRPLLCAKLFPLDLLARADALLAGKEDPLREELSRLRRQVASLELGLSECTCDNCLEARAARKEAGR